jgi:hypothetical protein
MNKLFESYSSFLKVYLFILSQTFNLLINFFSFKNFFQNYNQRAEKILMYLM